MDDRQWQPDGPIRFHGEITLGAMNAGKPQGHTHPPRFGDEGGEGVHAGMMTKQGAHELGRMMGLQPGTAPGEQTVGSSM